MLRLRRLALLLLLRGFRRVDRALLTFLVLVPLLTAMDGGDLSWLAPLAYAASSYLGGRSGVTQLRHDVQALTVRVGALETRPATCRAHCPGAPP